MKNAVNILLVIFCIMTNCYGQKYSIFPTKKNFVLSYLNDSESFFDYNNSIYRENKTFKRIEFLKHNNKRDNSKRLHSLSINPMKPFLGLINLNYELQFVRRFSISVFSEYLAFTTIKNFEHPKMVNKIGFSYYPLLQDSSINYNFFVNLNIGYVSYFNFNSQKDSYTNGIEIGYKWILKNRIIIQPKGLLNYQYSEKIFLPGFEAFLGFLF